MQDQELHAMPDDVLRARIREFATIERRMTANLLRHLGEYDARGLYEKDGCQNLEATCHRHNAQAAIEAFGEERIKSVIEARRFRRGWGGAI